MDSLVWESPFGFTCVDSSFCLDIVVSPLETAPYTLTVFDANGCSGSDQIIIEVDKNRNVYIPNVFSPNGDSFNDVFQPYIGPGVVQINSFTVFDRWGEILHQRSAFIPSSDFQSDDAWDGRFHGKVMNPGVYVYLIEVSFVDGVTLLFRGDVTLLH